VQALDRYATGAPSTIAIPTQEQASPTLEQEWRPDGREDLADEGDREAFEQYGPGQPDPRAGWHPRSGTLLALVAGVLGVAAIWPVVAVGLVVLWSWVPGSPTARSPRW